MSFSLQKKIREAEKLIKLNEYSKARDLYLDILAKFPNNIKALRALKTLKVLNVNEPVDISKSKEFNKLLQKYNNKEFKNVIKKARRINKNLSL